MRSLPSSSFISTSLPSSNGVELFTVLSSSCISPVVRFTLSNLEIVPPLALDSTMALISYSSLLRVLFVVAVVSTEPSVVTLVDAPGMREVALVVIPSATNLTS